MPAERYIGQTCELELGWTGKTGVAVSEWTEYEFEALVTEREASKARATNEQRVVIRKDASLTVRGYRGGDENFMALLEAGASLTSIGGTDIPDDLLTAYGNWKLVRKRVSQSADPGTWEMEFHSGFLSTVVTP